MPKVGGVPPLAIHSRLFCHPEGVHIVIFYSSQNHGQSSPSLEAAQICS